MSPPPVRITSFPNPYPGNPYLTLFYQHLRERGVEYVPGTDFGWSWLREKRGQVDYLHFHWPSFNYTDARGKRSLSVISRFLTKVNAARVMGYKIIWTVHNLYPHESENRFVEWVARFGFAQSVDLIFVHFPEARDDLRRRFGRRRGVHVVPHGNYAPTYPQIPDRLAARRMLGIDDRAYVFLVFGQMRPYKGADIAARALSEVNDPACQLFIVGQCKDDAHAAELLAIASRDARVHVVLTPDSLPDEEVGRWLAACDCVAAPYRAVYTSGVAYLAATFGKPIIAPRVGLFRSIADRPFVQTYELGSDHRSVAAAFAAVRSADPASIATAALRFSEEHDWHGIATRVAGILFGSR